MIVAGTPPPLSLFACAEHFKGLFLTLSLLTNKYQSCIIFTSFNIRSMGMRKKGRNKEKAQWKLDKITRDKKKLKRIRKAAATKVM